MYIHAIKYAPAYRFQKYHTKCDKQVEEDATEDSNRPVNCPKCLAKIQNKKDE